MRRRMWLARLVPRVLGIVAILASMVLPTTPANADIPKWTMSGNSVFVDDANVRLSATPHTLGSSGWVEFEIKSKSYSGEVDVGWGFSDPKASVTKPQIWRSSPHNINSQVNILKSYTVHNITDYSLHYTIPEDNSCPVYGNEPFTDIAFLKCNEFLEGVIVLYDSYSGNLTAMTVNYYEYQTQEEIIWYSDWSTITRQTSTTNIVIEETNRWQVMSLDAPITAGTTYKMRVWIDIPWTGLERTQGKYFFGIKPHSETMAQAKERGHLYYLDPWWDAAWTYRNILALNASACTENLTNFTVTVFLTPSRVDFSKIATNGTDLRFVDSDNTTLPYHITQWNDTPGSENATIVVQVPQIDAYSNYSDYIQMYYGNVLAADAQDKNAVWASTGAVGVWPLYTVENNDDSIYDSTSNNYTGRFTSVEYTSKGTASNSTGDTITPKYTAVIYLNHVVFLQVISHQPNGIGVINTPVGFTEASQITYTDNTSTQVGRVALFWRRCDGTEDGATVTVTRTGDTGDDSIFFGQIYKFTNLVTSGTPYEDIATTDGGGNTTNTWNAVNVTAYRLLATLIAEADDVVPVTPAGYTAVAGDATTQGKQAYLDISHKIIATSDGAVTSATGQTEGWVSFHLSLKGGQPSWTSQGRSFDGVDDFIVQDYVNWQSTDNQGSIGVWFKTSSAAALNLFCSGDQGSSTKWFRVGISSINHAFVVSQRNNDTEDNVRGATASNDNNWHMGFVTSNTTAYSLTLDGVSEGLTINSGANTGDWLSSTTGRDNWGIGALRRDTDSAYWLGLIGEVRVYNRPLSAEEIKYTKLSEQYFYTGIDGGFIYYGNEDPPPTLTTLPASGVTMDKDGVTSGLFTGNLTSLGGAPTVDYWFEYGTSNITYGSYTANTSTNTTGVKTAAIPSGLTPGQTYHFRFVGQNVDGTTVGADESFAFTMPTVTTGSASQNGLKTTLSGTVVNMGVASSCYKSFEWGYDTSYGHNTAQVAGGIGGYSVSLSGYDPEKTVYYRARVRVGGVSVIGAGASFVPTGTPVQTYKFMNSTYQIVAAVIPLVVIVAILAVGGFTLKTIIAVAFIILVSSNFMPVLLQALHSIWGG